MICNTETCKIVYYNSWNFVQRVFCGVFCGLVSLGVSQMNIVELGT